MNDDTLRQLDIIDAASAAIRRQLAPPAPAPPYFTARTDRALLTKPPLEPWGAAGSIHVDPPFGRPILRVTDQTMGGGRAWRVPSNAHTAAWNARSDAFFCMNGGGGVKVFEAPGPSLVVTSSDSLEPYSQAEPCWSRVDGDVLYTIGGPTARVIRRWSLSKRAFLEDVVDLDTITPGLDVPRTYVHGLLAAGDANEYLCILYGGFWQDADYLVLVYNTVTNVGRVINTWERFQVHLHGAAIDLSARYLMLYPRTEDIQAAGQVIIVDLVTDIATRAPRPTGHDALGFGVWVNAAESVSKPYDGAQWARRSLARPSEIIDLIPQQLTPMVKLADHPNWNHAQRDRDVPFVTALYRNIQDPKDPIVIWRCWDDEILAIDATGTGEVFRFGHHRSNVIDEVDPQRLDFWAEPIINVSPDGNRAIFTSNQERSLGPQTGDARRSRQDVFLLSLR